MSDRKIKINATNRSSAREMFNGRKDYSDYAIKTAKLGSAPTRRLSAPLADYEAIKDFGIQQRSLTGRADLDFYSILPRQEKLKNVVNSAQGINVFCFDFVADAFDRMSLRYEELKRANRVLISDDERAELNSVKAFVGYTSSVESFFAINRNFYTGYVNSLPKNVKNETRNFREFVDRYVDTLLSPFKKVPYFLSDYIKSPANSAMTSGLALEISTAKYSDDKYKVNSFLTSPNFILYNRLAREFGFSIDKQIPWRLVANLETKAMKRRLANRGSIPTEIKDVLYNYYTVVDTNDFLIMMNDLYSAYNLFVKNNSYKDKTSSRQEDENSSRVIMRQPIEIIKLSQIPTHEWITAYIKLKNKFSNINMDTIELNRVITFETDKINIIPLEDIITSINRKFNFTDLDEGSATYLNTKRKLRQSESLTDPLQQIKDFYVASLMNQY